MNYCLKLLAGSKVLDLSQKLYDSIITENVATYSCDSLQLCIYVDKTKLTCQQATS